MRIVHLAAGAGGMFCGSCLHGNTLSAALSRAGHEATLVPLYLPLRSDEPNVSLPRVAMGGINVYLRVRGGLLARLARPFRRWLDDPRLLRWAARRGGATRPEQAGALCLSMLRGDDGQQRAEIDALIDWLRGDFRPDLVHLNNALLAGLARAVQRRLDVPVVCTLAGEDTFLERLDDRHRMVAKGFLRAKILHCTALTAMNSYYADQMAAYLDVPRKKIAVIPPGIDLEAFASPTAPSPGSERAPAADRPRTIGFLARICRDKGLHELIEAAGRLATDAELPPLRFVAAGYLDRNEREYLQQVSRRAHELGLAERFEYVGELDRAGKVVFLRSLDLMCLPTAWPESKGLSVFEAWAAGVPVVLPEHGTFPELIARSGGGLTYPPGDTAALAGAIQRLLRDSSLAGQCARQGRAAVDEHFNAAAMAQRTIAWYEEVLAAPRR